jgi:hypothetical protein
MKKSVLRESIDGLKQLEMELQDRVDSGTRKRLARILKKLEAELARDRQKLSGAEIVQLVASGIELLLVASQVANWIWPKK